jgi:hypothetical protein
VCEREREREKERGKETVRERRRERERDRDRERERERELLFISLKGMTGALAPFSYLVFIIKATHVSDFISTIVKIVFCSVPYCKKFYEYPNLFFGRISKSLLL